MKGTHIKLKHSGIEVISSFLRTVYVSIARSPPNYLAPHYPICKLCRFYFPSIISTFHLKKKWDTWVAQSAKHTTSPQVMISRFVGLNPMSGSMWTAGAWSLLQILCLPLSVPPPLVLSLSLSQKLININFLNLILILSCIFLIFVTLEIFIYIHIYALLYS